MAKKKIGEQMLPNVSTSYVGRTNVIEDRQTTDGIRICG